MTNQKIILFVNSYLPVLGGIQTVSSQLAEGLKDKGFDVYVFTNKYPINLPFKEKIQGVSIKRFVLGNFFNEIKNVKPLMNLLISFLIYPFTFVHLFVSIYKIKPDVINIHFPLTQLPYIKLLQKLCKFKIVTSFHGHDVLRWVEGSKKSKLYYDQLDLITVSDQVTACSNYLSRKIETIYNLKLNSVITIYNGVAYSKNREITPDKSNYIFYFGRLEHVKGLDLLINAFVNISDSEILLKIAGDGSQLYNLKKLVSKYKLEERVVFLGKISQEEVFEYCYKSKLVVVPSRNEAFGLSVLEAIASGRSVLATNVGGIPEILDSRFGLLVEASADGLLNGMNKIIDKQHLYSDNKVDEYLKSFSVQSMISNYLKSYM
jgi:glycosyltransferase involved in cell wall biosynthesis